MWGGLVRVVLYVVFVTLPVWLAMWLGEGGEGILIDVGRNFALIGFMILIVQFLLAARIKWIERAFGLDILIRYHKYMALTAACLLIMHPILLALGHNSWKLLISLDLPWYILAGKTVLVLVVLNVLVSVYQGRIGLTFEKWRSGHDFLSLIILVFIFVHPWFAGDDLGLLSMQILWMAMFLLAAVTFVHHRFVRPGRLRRRPYRVEEVRQETEDVWTVKLVPPKGQPIYDYLPGQFHFLTFFRDPKLPVEEHHWTISSSPAQKDFISSTIKALGDFTSTIGQTKPGDTAAVHGPFGRFSYALHPGERDLVFLAGGIGITPLMAMLRHMRDTGDTRSVVLLYGNRNEDQIVFREALERIAEANRPKLTLVHVLSRPGEDWSGETGYIDRERIEKYCGENPAGKIFYICGPIEMARKLITILNDMGIPERRIRQEIFSFLD
ncbi:MAG: ferredoxin reductase family protein [Deltaproteobacteria bacterium]|nr:ferredoxin reductase family protein [Deltaproteobacteria bacterium]